jgi:hypothetical protein
MTIAALKAGKQACGVVPMAPTVSECLKIAEGTEKCGQDLYDDRDRRR